MFNYSISKLICVVLFIVIGQKTIGQTYRSQQNQILAYNIISNGLMGGIGGMINRAPNEKWHKAFLKNFGKGCLGGLVKYSAKSQTYYLRDPRNEYLALPNRLFFFAGHSMVMNASKNKGLFDTYHCNLLGVDMRWNIKNKEAEQKAFQARISLMTLGDVISTHAYGGKLDIYKSLEMGFFYFTMNRANLDRMVGEYNAAGTGFNTITFLDDKTNPWQVYHYIPHEMVHLYQSYDFYPITNFYYSRFIEKKLSKKEWYKKYKRVFVTDLDMLYFGVSYLLQPQPLHYRNFFEFEAEHFHSRNIVPR